MHREAHGPQCVESCVKCNKNEGNSAEAFCESVCQSGMYFVPMKAPGSQALLVLHHGRAGFVKPRTACTNQIRKLLSGQA